MLELLAPAGSMEALRAAVQNGADAVYLGAGSFNARMGAKNFSLDELQEAVTYCHVRGVAVHLTLNTLASDRELGQVAEVIRAAARRGVDAFIVQDLGVVSLCREIAPGIPVHASTQMSIHSLEGVQQAAAMGISRVVLARELPKEDIAYICQRSGVEIEVFVHGALCMCYSGQCYLSSVIGTRSGNRGQCAQPCRLPYGYGRYADRYPLSLKDNCLIDHLRELERMGVASIKIEGRAKRPEYVATVVRIYRSVLDGKPLSREDARELQSIFSRQGFTEGYYTGNIGPDMFGIRQESREDRNLLATARATYESGERPRVPVRFYAIVSRGQPAMLAAEDDRGNTCKTTGELPQRAVNRPLTAESLCARLQKTGGTPFYLDGFRGVIDPGLTLSAAAINAMRRDVLSELSAIRSRQAAPALGAPKAPEIVAGPKGVPLLTVSVLRADQITRKLLSARPAVLYLPLSELVDHRELVRAIPEGTELCAVLPRVIRDGEARAVLGQLATARTLGITSVLVGNLGQIAAAQALNFRVRGDFGLNLFNSRTMDYLRRQGLSSALCSFELTLPQIRDLSKAVPTELLVYGRLPLMLTENCIIHNRTGACTCSGGPTKLVDRKGQEFPIVRDPGTCRSVVLNGKKLYLLDKRNVLQSLGLWAVRLQFTTENPAEVSRVVADYQTTAPFDPAGCTRGLYQRGVE